MWILALGRGWVWGCEMRVEFKSERLEVSGDALLVRSGFAGHTLLCSEGRVWLTEEGLAEDVVLQAGEHYRVRGEGKLLIESVGVACLHLLAPCVSSAEVARAA